MKENTIIQELKNNHYTQILKELYIDESIISHQQERCNLHSMYALKPSLCRVHDHKAPYETLF